jgi:hypothetical protein
VRLDSSWCTLCYQDLRPAAQLVTTPAPQTADAGDLPAAPLVEASLESATGDWPAAVDAGEIVDAELVDEGKIFAPRDGAHDSDEATLAALDAELKEDGEPSRLAALTWSCKCGEIVSFADNGCPVCGGSFLGDLQDGPGGRHRPGHAALQWLPESRQVRLALSAFLAIAIAVFIPLFATLFG